MSWNTPRKVAGLPGSVAMRARESLGSPPFSWAGLRKKWQTRGIQKNKNKKTLGRTGSVLKRGFLLPSTKVRCSLPNKAKQTGKGALRSESSFVASSPPPRNWHSYIPSALFPYQSTRKKTRARTQPPSLSLMRSRSRTWPLRLPPA